MGCPPVREDNPRPLASGLSIVQLAKHSLGPVVNILAIFSNANILKNKRIKIYHIKGIGCPLLISININIVIFDQGTEK